MTAWRDKTTLLLVSIALLHLGGGCKTHSGVELRTVTMRNIDLYQLPTVGGDEEGARISTQAKHYRISEVRRDSATNWIATYVYQPAAGYTGADDVELELLGGSDGATAPRRVKTVRLHFVVHD